MQASRTSPTDPAATGPGFHSGGGAVAYLPPEQAAALLPQIREVYAAAFGQPPYSRGTGVAGSFANSFARHTRLPDFRFAAAQAADGQLLGFAYGYASLPGQWWHDLVAGALGAQRAQEWLAGSFELVELAVTPAAQRHGLGSRLHDLLLAGLPHPTAVLSTLQAQTTGLHLYHRRGWVTLLERFIFPGGEMPYRVMGRRTHA